MKPTADDKESASASPHLTETILKLFIGYLISAVIVLAICFLFGWRSLAYIGTAFIYGSLGLTLFGTLLLAGNTVPAQLSKLSLPSAKRDRKYKNDGTQYSDEGRRFFFATLICGAFLLVTGLIIIMFG